MFRETSANTAEFSTGSGERSSFARMLLRGVPGIGVAILVLVVNAGFRLVSRSGSNGVSFFGEIQLVTAMSLLALVVVYVLDIHRWLRETVYLRADAGELQIWYGLRRLKLGRRIFRAGEPLEVVVGGERNRRWLTVRGRGTGLTAEVSQLVVWELVDSLARWSRLQGWLMQVPAAEMRQRL